MHLSLREPITPAEVEDLAARLAAHPQGFSFRALQGFFAALASIPAWPSPNRWGNVVLGRQFASKQEFTGLVQLALRFCNLVNHQLNSGSSDFCPPVDDVDAVREWCAGYAQGCTLADDWHGDELPGLVELIDVIGILAGIPSSRFFQDVRDDESWLHEQRERLPEYARFLRRSWAPSRRAVKPPPGVQSEGIITVGPDDPCPCGCGKKYQDCCMR